MNERLRIALPTGQLEKEVLEFSQAIGLDIPEISRKYLISVENMPVDFVILRASDVPSAVIDSSSRIKAGITGSDIIWESGLGENVGEELPFNRVTGKKSSVSLFIGITKDFRDKIISEEGREPIVKDLSGELTITKFPNITTEYFQNREMSSSRIYPVQGKTEAMQYVYWDAYGIVDVVDTGNTIRENDMLELERFHEVTIRLITESAKLTRFDREILDDLREKIYLTSRLKDQS